MKKISTVVAKQGRNNSQQELTIGLDLGDRNSWYCVLQLLEQGAVDRRESQERRSAGCADLGAAGQDRSRVAVSGEASQCAGASGFDDDPGTCRTGAGANEFGEHGPRVGQELRRTLARLQRTRHGSGES